MSSLFCGAYDSSLPLLNIRRFFNSFLLVFISTHAWSADYDSGTYTRSLSAHGENSTLSGNITINLDSDATESAAVLADQNGQISGTVDSLGITLLNSTLNGVESQEGGKIDLGGPVNITNGCSLKDNYGMRTGVDRGMHFTGPVDIRLKGIRSTAVASMPGLITFDDALTVDVTGIYSSGLYLSPVNDMPATIHLNGATDIHARDQDNTSIAISGGTVYINNTLNVSTSEGANAIEMVPVNPASGSFLTTESPAAPQAPNPQKILLQGKIHLSNGTNKMMLDLAADSLINSQLNIDQGDVSWKFHSPSARWITAPGSRVGSQGKLLIDFINGGIWQFPLSADNKLSNPSATAPLIIEPGGEFAVNGQGVILGNVQTELQPGEQQKFVLVKKSFAGNDGLNLNLMALPSRTGLDLDLPALALQTDKPDYTLTLEQKNEENAGYLYATLTRTPDPGQGTVFWTPDHPDPATRIRSLTAISRDGAFSQQLPVNMVDQIIASRLLQGAQATSFCKQPQNSVWIGQCLDETEEPFSLWVLPLYDHITAKDFDLVSDRIGFKANIRGLGLRLIHDTHWGNWGAGLFSGTGDINSTEFNTPIHSDVDYLGGLIQGAIKVNPWVVNLGITYLHAKHHLRQYNGFHHLKSDSEIDVAGIQAGLAWPQYYGDWLVTPAAHLEFWHTHQPGNDITGDGNNLYVRSEGSQNYRQLPLSLTVQGPNLISGTDKKIRLIPQFDVRFIPSRGDRQLSTEVSLKNGPDTSVVFSTPEMDKSSTEAGISLQVAKDLLDGILRYNARHSSHILSQQISADIVWRW